MRRLIRMWRLVLWMAAVVIIVVGAKAIAANNENVRLAVLDDFNAVGGWETIKAAGTKFDLSPAAGFKEKSLLVNYDFADQAEWLAMTKKISLSTLPDNYEFSFYVKGSGPANTLEFKVIDRTGNVFWKKSANFKFSAEWKKIVVPKEELVFGWGPDSKKKLSEIDKIEFALSKGNGGQGEIYIDEFCLTALSVSQPVTRTGLKLTASGSSFQEGNKPEFAVDGNPQTRWSSEFVDPQWLTVDLGTAKVINKVGLAWEAAYGKNYQIQVSRDGKDWFTVFSTEEGDGGKDAVQFEPVSARYVRMYGFLRGTAWGYSLWEFEIYAADAQPLPLSKFKKFSEDSILEIVKANPKSYYALKAKKSPRGQFPRWFYNEFNYWTVVGSSSSFRESLFSDEGMIDCYENNFALIPYLHMNNELITPFNADSVSCALENGYLPIPTVTWDHDALVFSQKMFSSGSADSFNYVWYQLKNNGPKKVAGKLFLTIRPFQVTPEWMFGGYVEIKSIERSNNVFKINDTNGFAAMTAPDRFGAFSYEEGDIMDAVKDGKVPAKDKVSSEKKYASGALEYNFSLNPGQVKDYWFAIPMDKNVNESKFPSDREILINRYQQSKKSWEKQLNKIEIDIPNKKVVDALKTNLAYILIQKDGPAIQPGSRNYDRSWMRDGETMGSSLLRTGHFDTVKEFLNWMTTFQYENGRIPPIVYAEGFEKDKDKTLNEYDGQGTYIALVAEYYKFTKDEKFLREKFPAVVKALKYVESLRKQRLTDVYRNGTTEKKVLYGILPESISHEGYAEPGKHSYWDDFWALKGYDEAIKMAAVAGKADLIPWMEKERDDFRKCLVQSIKTAMTHNKVRFIPGCAELGDFDATSTAISVWPTEQSHLLDKNDLQFTLDKYYQDMFLPRLKYGLKYGYTPYEIRTATAYLMLGEKDKALKMLYYFLKDLRPVEWNHWAEVVHPGYREPGYVGDIPHSWIGGIYINFVRNLFLYESGERLILGAGIDEKWLERKAGLSVKNFPTYFGSVSYAMKKEGETVKVSLQGNAKPGNGFLFCSPFDKRVKKAEINGQAQKLEDGKIVLEKLPAELTIYY